MARSVNSMAGCQSAHPSLAAGQLCGENYKAEQGTGVQAPKTAHQRQLWQFAAGPMIDLCGTPSLQHRCYLSFNQE